MKNFQLLALSSLFVFSCAMNAPTASAESNDFTLGKVQSQLSEGMSSSQVVELLGSPNLVTSTQGGGEAWTYLKSQKLQIFQEQEQVQVETFLVFLEEDVVKILLRVKI